MTNVILPSSDADKQRIKGCVEEIANAMTMIQAQKDTFEQSAQTEMTLHWKQEKLTLTS